MKENRKASKKRIWLKWCIIAVCLAVVILGGVIYYQWKVQTAPRTSTTLYGSCEIYPTVMVRGELYEWFKGAAVCDALPDTCVYYGEITHVESEVPENDCEFASVFTLTGQIYTDTEDDSVVYLFMTTFWNEGMVVMFSLIETE